jgi:hypothetical protein
MIFDVRQGVVGISIEGPHLALHCGCKLFGSTVAPSGRGVRFRHSITFQLLVNFSVFRVSIGGITAVLYCLPARCELCPSAFAEIASR